MFKKFWQSISEFIWIKFNAPSGKFVGSDLTHNRYYEYPNPIGTKPRRKLRMANSGGPLNLNYTSPSVQVPAQWRAWLAHTRKEPPTIEELLADAERIRITRENAKRLELEYQAKKASPASLPPSPSTNREFEPEPWNPKRK